MSNIHSMDRRNFLARTSGILAGSAISSLSQPLFGGVQSKRQFKLCLNPGAIGVRASQQELLQMAIDYGYEAIVAMPNQLAGFSADELEIFVGKMKKHKISWGSTNLPVEFRKDETTFEDHLAKLPESVRALQKAGGERMNTWILNGDDELTYLDNFKQHARRLRACAEILEDHGVRLGLEYVGPKTSLLRKKYPFLRTMAEARQLIDEIGISNVGLVLDSFHWYCAEDTIADILALTNDDIVTCDINDARADLSRDEQIDGTRELPGATGIIDLKSFLEALVKIKYEGPVRSEPFNKSLNDMEDQLALEANYNAMKKAFELVN